MRTLALIALLLLAFPAQAAVEPRPSSGDPRIQVVGYDPSEVVLLRAALGYQLTIEFDPAEQIENVAIGDSLGWQVIPNRKANLLFVKPMERAPATNMTVVTNLRRYAFELAVRPGTPKGGDVLYTLRFEYPQPAPVVALAPEPPAPPQATNRAYSYEGSARNVPTAVFDDGQATYFQFGAGEDYPAIFALEADNGEAVVNFRIRDDYVVVDRIARGFVLRRGEEVTRIHNDGFRETAPGPLSPQPRPPKRGWFSR
jgi:type IV secretion system protein VirB9